MPSKRLETLDVSERCEVVAELGCHAGARRLGYDAPALVAEEPSTAIRCAEELPEEDAQVARRDGTRTRLEVRLLVGVRLEIEEDAPEITADDELVASGADHASIFLEITERDRRAAGRDSAQIA